MIKSYYKNIIYYFSQISSKARNDFALTSAAQVASLIISFITALIITNKMGLEGLGAYALIISISTFVAVLADVGIGQTAIRYASIALANSARPKSNEVLAWSINLRLIFAIVTLFAGIYLSELFATHVWKTGISNQFIKHAFVLGALTILQQCANSYYSTHHKFLFLSLINILNPTLILVTAVILEGMGVLDLNMILYVSVLSSIVTIIVVFLKTPWGEIYGREKKNKSWLRFNLKINFSEDLYGNINNNYDIKPQFFGFCLLTSSMIVTLFTRLDVWMVGAFLSEKDLGIYKLASYFAIPLALSLGALNSILWPRASKLVTQDKIFEFISKTFKISLISILPISFYIATLNWLPNIIFPSYDAIISSIAIALSIRYLLATLITPVAVVGYSLGMSKVYVFVNCLQLFSIYYINLLFINKIGLYAPALALIVSEFISIVFIWPLLYKRVQSLARS